ncbi:MAG TPA: hypothetical protein VND93_27160 [Myxococcales bacterium]|nr:hypothetical protein [Myxococcales bacterium]
MEASFELGGPFGQVEGYNLPLPLATAGASYGLSDRADAFASVHLTPAVFGVLGLDAGGDFLLLPELGPFPALNLTGRAYLFTDFRSARPYVEADLTASRLFNERFLTYFSVASMVQFAGGPPLLGIGFGEEVELGRWGLQLEVRWYEPGYNTVDLPTHWWNIWGTGSFGMMLGVRRRFGGGGV